MSALVACPRSSDQTAPAPSLSFDTRRAAGTAALSPRHPPARSRPDDEGPVLITGGAGFIGCNLADHLLARGRRVRIFDNLSRAGVERNLDWLRFRHGDRVDFRLGDIRDPHAVENAVRDCGPIFHLAARMPGNAGSSDPEEDFDINARGTIHLLDAVRRSSFRHPLVYASTSKVYGSLEDVSLGVDGARYKPMDPGLGHGFDEDRPVCFQAPCACSQAAAEQYVLHYARGFGLPAVALRLSCVYGPRQWGEEDHGWIAHFLRQTLSGLSVTLFGDGRQVRDALHVEDLVAALLLALENIDRISGRTFNLGGGPERTTSLLELMELLRGLNGEPPSVIFAPWRAADQRYYVSDIRRFGSVAGWTPRVALPAG
ncbi:MAG: hypothetical protein RLZZ50_1017, partial [Verrucomicrobiota bacterium]